MPARERPSIVFTHPEDSVTAAQQVKIPIAFFIMAANATTAPVEVKHEARNLCTIGTRRTAHHPENPICRCGGVVLEFVQHQSTNAAKLTMRTSTKLFATGGIIGVIAICVLVNQPRRPDAQISTSARAKIGPFSAPIQPDLDLTPLASSADDVKFTFEPSAPNGLLTFPIFGQGPGSAAQSPIQPRWVFHCKAPSIRRTSDPREAIDMMRTPPMPLVDFRYVPSADVLNAK